MHGPTDRSRSSVTRDAGGFRGRARAGRRPSDPALEQIDATAPDGWRIFWPLTHRLSPADIDQLADYLYGRDAAA